MTGKYVAQLGLGIVLAVLLLGMPRPDQGVEAATALADVGMVTMLSGRVMYLASDRDREEMIKPFMKIRTGDRLSLAGGASLQLVIFASGRKENWQGPMLITVRNNGTVAQGGGAPMVQEIPGRVTNEMRQVADLLETSRLQRSGSIMVRGGYDSRQRERLEDMELTPDQKEIIERARARYRELCQKAGTRDITAELYLFSVLADYDQFTEMEGLLAGMRKKQPANRQIDLLEEWLKDQVM